MSAEKISAVQFRRLEAQTSILDLNEIAGDNLGYVWFSELRRQIRPHCFKMGNGATSQTKHGSKSKRRCRKAATVQWVVASPAPLSSHGGKNSLRQKELAGIMMILLTFTRVDALRSTSRGSDLVAPISILQGCPLCSRRSKKKVVKKKKS